MPESKSAAEVVGESVVVEATGFGRFQVEVHGGSSSFLIDEPVTVGGLGSGPNPYDLLVSALGACTLMTVRLYANHKNWPLDRIRVRVTRRRRGLNIRDLFETEVLLEGALDDVQRARLIEIAGHCPVHRTLEHGVEFSTKQVPLGAFMSDRATGECDHVQNMEDVQEA